MRNLALAFNILHLFYFLVTTTINLFPFNNIRSYTAKQKFIETSVNGIIMSLPIIALIFGQKLFTGVSCFLLFGILVGEYLSWWRHYFFKPTAQWQQLYDTLFKPTIIVLPPIKNNPIPNLEHTILHSLTVFSFIFTLICFLQ